MTEKDFLNVYSTQLIAFVNLYKDELENISNESSQIIRDKIYNHTVLIIEKGNLLVTDILFKNGIDSDTPVTASDLSEATLSSVLAHKTFSIQIKVKKDYDKFSESILSEALCRDFPEDCLEDL